MLNKFTCPPQASGQNSFSDNLVGFQLVDGGGFTQGNFQFTSSLSEKQDRNFEIGSFSDPISLDSMNIGNVEQSRMIVANNFQVFPNYDLSEVTNFTVYGSLKLRFSNSITRIINYFPAGIEVNKFRPGFVEGNTAINIIFDSVDDETELEIPLDAITNPLGVDYTTNADRNIESSEISISSLRNMKKNYNKYSLFLNGSEYPINDIIPTTPSSTTLKLYVLGNPFSGLSYTNLNFLIRPNDINVNKVFNEDFDNVENFLLNRTLQPLYTAYFQVPVLQENGTYIFKYDTATFPLDGNWNIDIRTTTFNSYLEKINTFAQNFDEYKTNLISRFLTTPALKEFDVVDKKVEKMLQIYGRSFDNTKKFIDALSMMNSVNYSVKNDIPSQLLKNLAQTLGWSTNISPITETNLLDSVFKPEVSTFTGVPKGQTPEELNYQYYRNLILNSAFLFKSKGTRKSIEILLRLIGAPDFLVDFNEYIYVADQRINLSDFDKKYAQISGGTYVQQTPVLDPTDVFSIMGVQYTGVTYSVTTTDISITQNEYPIDNIGCPSTPVDSESYYFQIGGGWFESTPQHRMPEKVNITTSVFTGSNPDYQTTLLPFNYGEEYLERYRNFPYMDLGFRLRRSIDNNKSWTDNEDNLRKNSDGNFNAYYSVGEECLVLNVKNVDVMLNPSFGLLYDVYTMSRTYNYPIPNEGLQYTKPTYCNPDPINNYPRRGGIDWTEIKPKPKEKTFFEFAQTFWRNMINVRNRQFITDGKTGGYPTLQSIYWKYLQSDQAINIPNDNFTYQTMIDYVNGLGTYWVRLVEQMVPATTIWNTGVRLENSIFHRQKFVWRRQFGCKIVPVPCNPCELTTKLFAYDCPLQQLTCGLYPWNSNTKGVESFGGALGNVLNSYLTSNSLTPDVCLLNTLDVNWYVQIKLNGSILTTEFVTNTIGYVDQPTNEEWVMAVSTALDNLETSGISYFIDLDRESVTIYNNNCVPYDKFDVFEINLGINFNILCNQ
jgi:hypothetical protein